jgi:hypothetical protein
MTPLKNRLQAIGKLHKWQPWYEKLSKLVTPNPVVFIFIDAELKDGVLFFDDTETFESAKKFRFDVAKVLPNVTMASRTQVLPWEVRQHLGATDRVLQFKK